MGLDEVTGVCRGGLQQHNKATNNKLNTGVTTKEKKNTRVPPSLPVPVAVEGWAGGVGVDRKRKKKKIKRKTTLN